MGGHPHHARVNIRSGVAGGRKNRRDLELREESTSIARQKDDRKGEKERKETAGRSASHGLGILSLHESGCFLAAGRR